MHFFLLFKSLNDIIILVIYMRENILKLLENEYSALDTMTINDKLGLTSVDELRSLEYELDLLVKDQIVYFTNKKKYILYSKCPDFRKGKMQINPSGNGFVVLEDENDVFVHRSNIGLALDGDIVLVKIIDTSSKKPEGMIVKVLERDLNNIVGVIKSDGKNLFFEPYEERNITLTIDEDSLKRCVEGEVVVVSIVDDLGKNRYSAEVTKHICHKDDANSDILEIAANYDIFEKFSDEAMAQAEEMPVEITGELLNDELKIRKDLRDKMIFTIDGADTKDVDDAISLEYKDGYYLLGVHIADVSHYVTEGSPLDIDAYQRGTSSYLAYSVIPMLPHKLSNGICSLNPDVVRCALSCEMKIDNRGIVVESEIFPSLIRSNKKMTYTDVNSIIEKDVIPEGYEKFADTLKLMNELAHIIRNERTKRGASDFDMDEAKIICDDEGKPIEIKKRERGEGERLIEDFMVITNETVAKTLSEYPSIYRVHDIPNPEKIQSFISFCNATGQQIKGKFNGDLNPKMYQSLLNQINVDGPQAIIYKSLAVRSMPKAFYGKDNIGHFGLAVIAPYNAYTHFTSPIRRYPDLQIHRLIWAYLINNKTDERTINYWNNNLDGIAKHCSDREIKAVEAEREVDKMKMAEYMESHIGEEYEGIITGVTGFGFFVQLENLIEGLVSVTSLEGGDFELVAESQCLRDSKTKKTYRIGDLIKVKCVAASKEAKKIDFEEIKTKELKNNHDEKVPEEEKVLRKKKHHGRN